MLGAKDVEVEKEVEQEETQVDETQVSSRLAEAQDRAVENEITENGRGTMPMMLSKRRQRSAGCQRCR